MFVMHNVRCSRGGRAMAKLFTLLNGSNIKRPGCPGSYVLYLAYCIGDDKVLVHSSTTYL